MTKGYLYTVLFCFVFVKQSCSQELKLFTIADFDLNGKVKECTVITNYGQEVFEFDKNGFLVKLITAYNEDDKDITTYRYKDGFLLEKRMESYKDNVLDESTSMANFYEIDTTKKKVIREQIVSYDKEFLEQQEYIFGEEDKIAKITSSHENAVDETRIAYTKYKDEITKTFFVNGIIEKSIRTSTKRSKDNKKQKIILTKEFIDGEANKAVEQRFNDKNELFYEEYFLRDITNGGFTSQEIHLFEYNDGVLFKETVKKGNGVSKKEYIFKFDNNEDKNWVKKIITPENAYTTRKIEYYKSL